MKRACLLSLVVLFLMTVANQGDCSDTTASIKSLKTESDCVKLSQQACNLIHEGKISEAHELLYGSRRFIRGFIPILEKQADIANIKALTNGLTMQLGGRIKGGVENVGTLKTGDSMLTVYFTLKYDYSPTFWKMTFYKPKGEWKFMEFSTGPELLFEVLLTSKQMPLNE